MCMSQPKAAKPAPATAPVVAVDGKQQNGAIADRARQRGLASMWTRYNTNSGMQSGATTQKADKLGG